jgi:cyclophilin family peptidyl-prolyl cis-trans isomerase
MPRSRRFRKNQNQVKPEWGKNNPQNKAKNKKLYIAVGVILVAAVAVSVFVVLGQNTLFATPTSSPSPSVSPSETENSSATPSVAPTPTTAPLTSPVGEYSAQGSRVLLRTSMGDIVVQMRDDKPITTSNFVKLVKQGLYNQTIFHRVIAGFMIQGGAVNSAVSSIADEVGNDNRNTRGTIAMAKTSDPNSATSQFFINLVDNGYAIIDNQGTRFDQVYTVFGQVIQGMDVVDAIANVQVTTNAIGENSQPVQTVTLIFAEVL